APEGPRAKKSLGQHFLMHRRIAERIAEAAGFAPGDTVLEIGPGTGILTRALLARGARVVAVEADAALAEGLRRDFVDEIARGRLALTTGDIRAFDLAALPAGYQVVANIPYYITGEILRLLLSAANQPAAMTLLVQKEVAERIARAKKGSLLALSVAAYGTPRYEFTVPKGAFRPPPAVDSAVLSVRGISRVRFAGRAEERFFALIRAGFAHKRKRLAKNLAEAGFAAAAGAVGNARAEDLSLLEWLALAANG
ncbi:MAG: ribosomal RNA small subunit methyltransferase A, partial [Patescibacteria group bacterium]|nr:ribosomal RNA small subunit methyltransferase A [Patescibacteria group bacterium]